MKKKVVLSTGKCHKLLYFLKLKNEYVKMLKINRTQKFQDEIDFIGKLRINWYNDFSGSGTFVSKRT